MQTSFRLSTIGVLRLLRDWSDYLSGLSMPSFIHSCAISPFAVLLSCSGLHNIDILEQRVLFESILGKTCSIFFYSYVALILLHHFHLAHGCCFRPQIPFTLPLSLLTYRSLFWILQLFFTPASRRSTNSRRRYFFLWHLIAISKLYFHQRLFFILIHNMNWVLIIVLRHIYIKLSQTSLRRSNWREIEIQALNRSNNRLEFLRFNPIQGT